MDLAELETYARQKMAEHGLQDWGFGYDAARLRLGRTDYTHRRITVSRSLAAANSPEVMRNTVLHELAHAIAGYKAAHGPEWQAVAVSLGAQPWATVSSSEIVYRPRYAATCPQCGYSYEGERRTKSTCPDCSVPGVPVHFRWRENL